MIKSEPLTTSRLFLKLISMSNSPVVHLCQEALAKDIHINASDVRVVSVEAGQWPDSGLGCHQPYA